MTSANLPDSQLARADRDYKPLLPFSEWQHCEVPVGRWDAHLDSLAELRRGADDAQLRRSLELVKQLAAIETGAIEGLYDEDRGFTITAATEVAAFTAALDKRGAKTRAYIEAQLGAYDFVLDMATQVVPMAEAWIRQLHQVICGPGATYRVETAVGPQEQQLPLGVYKAQPNHVELPSGQIHSYAPVGDTAAEMQRFVAELQRDSFQAAHPVLQAAYSHYGVVWIHPFADGNGRVARALASVYTYRAASVPILITAQQKPEYLAALRAADAGDRQAFVRFIFEKILDTMRFIGDALRTAAVPDLDDALTQLRGIYRTDGGYDLTAIDEAAYRIFDVFRSSLETLLLRVKDEKTHVVISVDGGAGASPDGFRLPVLHGSRRGVLTMKSAPPAQAEASRAFIVYVPVKATRDDVLRLATGDDYVDLPLGDVVGASSVPVQVEARLKMFAQRVMSASLEVLRAAGQTALKERGY